MKNLARSKLVIRKIRRSDLQKGFLESLDSLRTASNISRERAEAILKKIASNPDHVIFVAEKDGMIVGSTTLIIEQKFIHNGGKVGHIEDVVVAKQMQGKCLCALGEFSTMAVVTGIERFPQDFNRA